MSVLLSVILYASTVYGAADTACTESGRNYQDGAVVLQVVLNRARGLGGGKKKSLLEALYAPYQHAHGCRWPLTAQHWLLGYQFVQKKIASVPEWATKALWYCNSEPEGTCENRCKREDPLGCPLLGREAHRFYGKPPYKKIAKPTPPVVSSRI